MLMVTELLVVGRDDNNGCSAGRCPVYSSCQSGS
ncbi:Uncharacterized protein FWK35_00039322 [Aphis craccivora]|uniref:Uncharacterized protein n=1 Tax=Aphis craccivora TaxID=307492 RepID=A0A6G0YY34_APHCR|nr:Uncharacterized protein FWK35_00039322 [Aphis craccivora]